MKSEARPRARLLIADDHALVREGMRSVLASEPDLEVVGEAADGEEALELCRRLCPELVVMDVRMPKMDGLEATRKIKRACPKTRVLILTTHESQEYLTEAIKAGAAGYVLKESNKRQLLGAIRRAIYGESPINQELAMGLLRRLLEQSPTQGHAPRVPAGRPPAGQQEPSSPLDSLTSREVEVLRLLARGQTNQQIAKRLLLSVSTVKKHVRSVIAKLGVSDRTQAAIRAIELGLPPGQEDKG